MQANGLRPVAGVGDPGSSPRRRRPAKAQPGHCPRPQPPPMAFPLRLSSTAIGALDGALDGASTGVTDPGYTATDAPFPAIRPAVLALS
jgi:hypothetical protein